MSTSALCVWFGLVSEGHEQGRIEGVATRAVADEALAIWSTEAPDKNQ